MKVRLQTESTALPGYKKVFLCFGTNGSTLSRKIGKALQRKDPVYLAGAEPKVSLYLGERKVPEQIAKAKVSDKKAAAYSRLSFWDQLKVDDPAYIHDCICGCKFRTKKHYRNHVRRCSVLQFYSKIHERARTSPFVDEHGDEKTKKRRAKEKREEDRRAKAAENARSSKDLGKTKVRRRAKKQRKRRS